MEKYTKFRDRGSGIAPFFPIPANSSTYFPVRVLLFSIRLPLLISISVSFFLFLQWLPLGVFIRKAVLWSILGIPGIWWVDLQIDGVRRGSLSQNLGRVPQGGTIIAATSTSPLDALYIGAVFDGVFTISYPGTHLVKKTSLLGAILNAFASPELTPPPGASLVSVEQLLKKHPFRPVVVFPECTTTNGRGVLRLSPSLLSAPTRSKIFPVSLKYSAADVTTPIPASYVKFLWDLLSAPTHSLRVRIAEAVLVADEANMVKADADAEGDSDAFIRSRSPSTPSGGLEAQKTLDVVAEHLARLGRVKCLGLGVEDKEGFLKVWQSKRH